MKVCCKKNNIFTIEEKGALDRLTKYIRLSDGQLNVELNAEYVVYGICFRENSPWYYLCLDDDDEYPSPFPSELFEVLDSKISDYFALSSFTNDDGLVESSLVFDEWSQDYYFYEKLVDGDPKVIKVFQKYRRFMDQEHQV